MTVAALRAVARADRRPGVDRGARPRCARCSASVSGRTSWRWRPATCAVPGAGSQLGWLLWADALEPEAAQTAAARLCEPDILTAFGLRTLAASDPNFAPDRLPPRRGLAVRLVARLGRAARRGARAEAERVRTGVLAALDRLGRAPELYAVERDGDARADRAVQPRPGVDDRRSLGAGTRMGRPLTGHSPKMDLETATRAGADRARQASRRSGRTLPGPFTAALTFRAGIADEVLADHGITHLLEHVVLSAVGRREHPLERLRRRLARASSAPRASATRCSSSCAWSARRWSTLPGERVDRRAPRAARRGRAARSRASSRGCSTSASAQRATGSANYRELGLRWLARPRTCATGAPQRFTRGNAVLWMTGEPPDGPRRSELPDGPRRPAPGARAARRCGSRASSPKAPAASRCPGSARARRRCAWRRRSPSERLYDTAAPASMAWPTPRTGGYMALGTPSATRCSAPTAATSDAGVVLQELWRMRARPGRARRHRGGARPRPPRRSSAPGNDPDRSAAPARLRGRSAS